MVFALVAAPLLFAALALALPSQRLRPWLLPACGATHLGLVLAALRAPQAPVVDGWLALDDLGRLLLPFVSLLFFLASIYAPGYLALRSERKNRFFVAGLMAVLGGMSLVILAQHPGLLWLAMETNTLATAPLIYFNKNPRSIEATWKYLLVGSVGIALSLLGTFFLAYGALTAGLDTSLFFKDLIREAPHISKPWLHAAFVLLFVGYGTKMGLAPMHTWKPDAYGEAPGLVGVILAGGLTSCAFLAVLRSFQICAAAGDARFAQEILVVAGLFSMGVAGAFMVRQRDYKRMLAYSSVEHMGILVLGVGLGSAGVLGAMLHLLNNGFTKGVLFLCAGNINRAYGSRLTGDVAGVLRRLPVTGGLLLAGFFAITGSPPFAPFVSEFAIVRAAMSSERYLVGGLFLAAMLVVFLGMGATVLDLVLGEPTRSPHAAKESPLGISLLTVGPPAAFMSLVLLLGLYLPPPVAALVRNAAAFVSVTP